jgi:hypothetical protein
VSFIYASSWRVHLIDAPGFEESQSNNMFKKTPVSWLLDLAGSVTQLDGIIIMLSASGTSFPSEAELDDLMAFSDIESRDDMVIVTWASVGR